MGGKGRTTNSKAETTSASVSETDIRPPKRPMNAYQAFMKSEVNNFKGMPFKEMTPLLASKWKSLSDADKKPFVNKQEEDRKRYDQEMAAFWSSSKGKQYKQMQQMRKKQKASGAKCNVDEDGKKRRRSKNVSKETVTNVASTSDVGTSEQVAIVNADTSVPYDPLQIPVFNDRFLDFNRKRDHQLRQLRRASTEVENENLQLLSHMKAMKAMIARSEQDAVRLLAHNEAITTQLEQVKRSAIERVKSVPSYTHNETLKNYIEQSSNELDADEFLSELSSFMTSTKVGLSEKMSLKAALKKVDYPKDPEQL